MDWENELVFFGVKGSAVDVSVFVVVQGWWALVFVVGDENVECACDDSHVAHVLTDVLAVRLWESLLPDCEVSVE